MRLLSSQLDAYFTDGLWLDNARHANADGAPPGGGTDAAARHAAALSGRGQRDLRRAAGQIHDALQAAGAQYHPWPSDRPGERAFRLVTAFDTDPADVDQFLSIAKRSLMLQCAP